MAACNRSLRSADQADRLTYCLAGLVTNFYLINLLQLLTGLFNLVTFTVGTSAGYI